MSIAATPETAILLGGAGPMSRLLVIGGSLRDGSHTTALARAVVELAPGRVAADIYDGLATLPPYDADTDTDEGPAQVRRLRNRIAEADGVLFITPEYNGSIPGVLKNAIDWASRPHRTAALSGKTVAVAGASPSSYGALWAVGDLRRVLGIAGARVVDGDLLVPNVHELLSEGALTDVSVRQRLRQHIEALVAETRSIAAAAA